MSDLSIRISRSCSILGLCLGMMVARPPDAGAWRTVFDPWNYQQNIMTASQTLTAINQQIEQLRNETQMLLNMDLDLTALTDTVAPELLTNLSELQSLIEQADGLRLAVKETEERMRSLFPEKFDDALSGDDLLQAAQERWQEALSAYKRSALLEAQLTENTEQDGNLLQRLLSRSQSASGNLEVTQVGNELVGLSVKQNLQLQKLLAARSRAETLNEARALAAEEEARVKLKKFIGENSIYQPDG